MVSLSGLKIRSKSRQLLAAAVAVVFAAAAGVWGVWVFRPAGRDRSSFWPILFSDEASIGFVRAAVVMLAIYVIGSVAALLISGRWIRSLGRAGLDIDPISTAEKIEALERDIHSALAERDRAMGLLEVFLGG